LKIHYDAKHMTVLYQAAQFTSCDPIIQHIPLGKIPKASINGVTTLYVPPKGSAPLDYAMVDRLGIPREQFRTPEQSLVPPNSRSKKSASVPKRRRRRS
jgi:hypothetical protein